MRGSTSRPTGSPSDDAVIVQGAWAEEDLPSTSADNSDAPLLRKRDGTAWQATSTVDHRDLFRRAVERAELGVAGVTSYALRHSSIVRALLGGVPVAVAAQLHDTSVREIEAHYAAFILDHSDALTRRTLLDTAAPVIAERWPTLRGVGT